MCSVIILLSWERTSTICNFSMSNNYVLMQTNFNILSVKFSLTRFISLPLYFRYHVLLRKAPKSKSRPNPTLSSRDSKDVCRDILQGLGSIWLNTWQLGNTKVRICVCLSVCMSVHSYVHPSIFPVSLRSFEVNLCCRFKGLSVSLFSW